MKTFEKTASLKSLKTKIVKDDLKNKYFLSDYNISYNPMAKSLRFSFDCSRPLMRAEVYGEDGSSPYNAVLVESGNFVDPTYETLLRTEKKLNRELPSMAIPVSYINTEIPKQIITILNSAKNISHKKLSEVIVDNEGALTIILSVNGRPASVFMGQDEWKEKAEKLSRIVSYMYEKKKVPAVINMTNLKKVVVKFSSPQ